MKKQYILIISIIIVLVIVGGLFFFKSKQNNNFNPQMQNIEEVTLDSLSVGNWVSVVAEKNNGLYVASMIMACDGKDSCQNGRTNNQPSSGTPPTGGAPTGDVSSGNAPIDSNAGNKTMLSGTITEVNIDNIVLSLDTGETTTVSVSDSTRIIKR